jgi:negative regulator of flagellin synthesis FlgM
MMGKINIDKISGYSSIRAERRSEIKKSGTETAQPVENKKSVDKDKLEFSSRASEVGKFVEQLKELPDIRQEKVNSLREQISAGSYNPSGEEIADAILKDEKS